MDEVNYPHSDLVASRARDNATKRSVNYFFDRPNIVRRPGNKTALERDPVLAAFDADNAVIWANQVLLDFVERNRGRTKHLGDEDVETVAHEFARALQYRDILEEHFVHMDRVAALRKRRSLQVARSTVESYANQKLARERKAEEVVQRVRIEILSAFDRAQRGSGLSATDIADKAEEIAAGMVRDLRDDFTAIARQEFVRLHSEGGDVSRSVSDVYSESDGIQKQVLPVRDLRWLFPVDQSPTLADLVDEIISFELQIIVPVTTA